MLTVIEKVMLLRDIPIFSTTTTEDLARIASIAQEVEFNKGDTIFNKDDPGDAMYCVIRGTVRLHKEDIDIFIVTEKDSFGELEVLANEPRFVAATVLEDVHALKISNEDFYELLSDNIKIAQDIFKVLVGRIKELLVNAKMSLIFWLKDD
jgi:CRP-like cAMP-binding protein